MGGDLSGSFSARTGEVLEITSCDEKGNRTEPGAARAELNSGRENRGDTS